MHEMLQIDKDGQSPANAPERAMARFCDAVGSVVGDLPAEDIPGRIADMLPALLSRPDLLNEDQCRAPATGYDRHMLYVAPDDSFSVMSLVWPAGVSSPVHDHATWCAFGVWQGAIEEARFLPVGNPDGDPLARQVSTDLHGPGAASFLVAGTRDIHRIHNPGAEKAVSLHVYGGNCATQGPNVDTVYRVGS